MKSLEQSYQCLKDILSDITFDDQSIGLDEISVYGEIVKRNGIKGLTRTLEKVYTFAPEDATEEMFYQIDITIGTSPKQQKELEKVLLLFFKSIRF